MASLDTLAASLFSALPESRAAIYEEAQEIAKSVGEAGAYYIRVMEKIVNGGEAYVEKETKRYVYSLVFQVFYLIKHFS